MSTWQVQTTLCGSNLAFLLGISALQCGRSTLLAKRKNLLANSAPLMKSCRDHVGHQSVAADRCPHETHVRRVFRHLVAAQRFVRRSAVLLWELTTLEEFLLTALPSETQCTRRHLCKCTSLLLDQIQLKPKDAKAGPHPPLLIRLN